MSLGFWSKLKKPIMVLAPMANVTDAAFRRIIAKYGKPDVTWTEFVSVEGLLSAGKEKLLIDFWYRDEERPIVAQIFGSKPEQFTEVAKMVQDLGFDGIDINMGCPDRGVERSGGGASLIKNPKLAAEIIAATKVGAGKLPVSVKTRLGYNESSIEEWIPHLLEAEPAALTLHLRTRKEMSDVPAHWEVAERVVAIRDGLKSATLILGNGDVKDIADAEEKIRLSHMDGVMIGRGIFGNPWLFSKHIPSVEEKLRVMVEHTELFEELFHSNKEKRLKNFDVMKKHYKAYANGFDGAKELRGKLMETEDAAGVKELVWTFLEEGAAGV
jgi:nifR3 family TIM-barrel protein